MTSTKEIILDYVPFKIEVGKIKEFALAIGSTNPIYFDKEKAIEKGFPAIPVPPTFFTVIDYWNDRDFYKLLNLLKIDYKHVLHGEQGYEYFHDVFEGDTISSQLILTEQYVKNVKKFIKFRTIYKNQLGITVAISYSTLIELLEVPS